MADEPKPAPSPRPDPAGEQPAGANISPSPVEAAGTPPGEAPPTGASATPANGATPTSGPQPDALSDGTKPTILKPGSSHRAVPKGKASITTIYRKADILTTLLTFGGAILAAVILLGGYAFLNRPKNTPTATPKVTSLSKSDLDKLGAFFSGNSAGNSSEVLTISSSSLFNNRVAISSDLKVVGGLQVSGSTSLADLSVDKTSTLGVTSVRGSLTVAGPLSLQSPATLGAGGTVKGDLAVSGNGSFGGSISAGVINVSTLTVSGTLNLNSHLSIGGVTPSATPISGTATSASVEGNDAAGTVTVNVAPNSSGNSAQLVTVTFHNAYPRAPYIVITPIGAAAAALEPFILKTATNFTVGAATLNNNGNATTYSFDYWVVQ